MIFLTKIVFSDNLAISDTHILLGTLPRRITLSPVLHCQWGHGERKIICPKGKQCINKASALKLPDSKPHLFLTNNLFLKVHMKIRKKNFYLCKKVLYVIYFAKLYSFWKFSLLKNKLHFPRTDVGLVMTVRNAVKLSFTLR